MIFVTGASGNVGREVVAELIRHKADFRIGVHGSAADIESPFHQNIAFDFWKPETFAPAVEGCNAVFLLRPPAISNTKATLNVFLDVAWRRGVTHVVFLSVTGAAGNPLVPHHAVEQHLRSGPQSWTILRPGFFVQNLGDAYRRDIYEDDMIYVPAGAGNVAFIDVCDIAEVAVMALMNPIAHNSKAYTLTGPNAVSFADVAHVLSVALARHITYTPASVVGYMRHLQARGLPLTQRLIQTVLHVGLKFGQAQQVNPTLAQLLSHPPRTVNDYVMSHLDLWQKPGVKREGKII